MTLDFGEHDGRFFIVREYVEGESLEGLLRRDPAISLAQRLAPVEQLCAGLSSAHDAGILHNHLKPSNLLISTTGRLKMTDFSIAQSMSARLTASGGLLGVQFYLSPEQITGEVTDHRSDLFVAGLILYECITLRRSFGGDGLNLFHHVLSQRVLPIEQCCPDVDPELVVIVARAVAWIRSTAIRTRARPEQMCIAFVSGCCNDVSRRICACFRLAFSEAEDVH